MFKENEEFVTLTEQGNFGLGIGHIKDKEEKNRVKEQLLNQVEKKKNGYNENQTNMR